jgi:hypothetical protein
LTYSLSFANLLEEGIMKNYVGLKNGCRLRFLADEPPTEKTHGEMFNAVIGPFRTKRAAEYCANNRLSPLQSVKQFERAADPRRIR